MAKNGIAVVVTVFNEEQTIEKLLDGLLLQTRQPNEVVITDAGSTDATVQLIKAWQNKHSSFPLKLIVKRGNRSVGRNTAIRKTTYNLIAITDAGCVPHKNWLYHLEKKLLEKNADVVAGYYNALPSTPLEQAIVPYMLVMPDRVNPREFLPATRSMLVPKHIWKKIRTFDESLTVSEDYAFAKKIRKQGYTIAFAKKAIVTWLPFGSLSHFLKTVANMAEHDVRAGVIRVKAVSVYLRYLLFGLLLWFSPVLFFLAFGAYVVWSVTKNARYVPQGWFWLPLLQVLADLGVMVGTLRGTLSF